MGSSADTLECFKPGKHKGPSGRDIGVRQQPLLCITASQLLPAMVPSGKPGACQAWLSIPDGPETADKPPDIPPQVSCPVTAGTISC